jgi:hypothetical protein
MFMPGGMSWVASGPDGKAFGELSCRRRVFFGPIPAIFPMIIPCSPDTPSRGMSGMLMFFVATLTQYWVTGVLAFSAAAAGDTEKRITAAAAVIDVHFRRLMGNPSIPAVRKRFGQVPES